MGRDRGLNPSLQWSRTVVRTRECPMEFQEIVDVFLLAENRLLREALIRILAKKSDIRVVGASPYSPIRAGTNHRCLPQHCSAGFRCASLFRSQICRETARRDSRCARRHDRHGTRSADLSCEPSAKVWLAMSSRTHPPRRWQRRSVPSSRAKQCARLRCR